MVANYPEWFSLCQINNLNRTLFRFIVVQFENIHIVRLAFHGPFNEEVS